MVNLTARTFLAPIWLFVPTCTRDDMLSRGHGMHQGSGERWQCWRAASAVPDITWI